MQSNGSVQIFQLAGKCIRQSRQSAKRKAHGEVLPLHKASANVRGVRIPLTHFGYNLRDSWWGVPFISELTIIAIELRQLREVNIRTETLLDCLAVKDISIRGELDSLGQPTMQVADEKRLPKYPNLLQVWCWHLTQVTSALSFPQGRPIMVLQSALRLTPRVD